MEKRIVEISEKVDRLIMNMGREGVHGGNHQLSGSLEEDSNPISHANPHNVSSPESLSWEACSEITSVPSKSGTSIVSTKPFTPTTEPIALSSSPEGVEPNPMSNSIPCCSIPAEWRKPICLKTRNELIDISQQAIDFVINCGERFSVKVGQNRNFKIAMSTRDRLIRSRRHKDDWPLNESNKEELYDDLFNALMYLQIYYAYQTRDVLSCGAWHWSRYAESDDTAKTILKPNSDVIRVSDADCHLCLNVSGVPRLAGGLLGPNLDKYNVLIGSTRTVQFMTLSSYLAECTGDKKYLETALLTASCIKTWMVDSSTSLIKDCLIDALSAKERDGSVLSCYLTGLAIEGLTVLAHVTRDDGWRSLAIDVARSAMLYGPWHTSDGILNICSDRAASDDTNIRTLKGLLNRGLMVAYERNSSNKPFCDLVRSYINVQFNALFELARFQDSYGIDWRGPYVGPHGHGQVAALDTLVAAIAVNDV
ncbi:hypothetical protein FRC03_006636 [Tulasnella sp. 419]|nr:hypothetical protein FRC03_006636 [Tulasnella sp. 419]